MKFEKRTTENNIERLICSNLGVSDYSEVLAWEKKHYEINGLKGAAELIRKFKDQQVTICGDYDVDGQTSTTILWRTLRALGFKNVKCKIPRRFTDGFGLKASMLEDVNEGLVITVDNGIAAIDAISYAKSKGLTVIVTDHHEPIITEDGEVMLPNADIIIDPKAIKGTATFDGYCGAGIAYKIAQEMLDDKFLLDRLETLACIGTICDVMQLHEDNYWIVKRGLDNINKGNTFVGVTALMEKFGINEVDANDIGYYLGPALNSNGRLMDDGAKYSAMLLMTDEHYKAKQLSESTYEINKERKELKEKAIEDAYKYIEEKHLEKNKSIVAYLPNVHEGIVGIVAGDLSDEKKGLGVPAVVLAKAKEGNFLKGSARSIEGVNIKECLDEIAEYIYIYGGHSGAAGLTIEAHKLDDFTKALERAVAKRITTHKTTDKDVYKYDIEITAEEVANTLAVLKKYAPFGEGNPYPVIKVTAVPIPISNKDAGFNTSCVLLGESKKTVKLHLSDTVDAISFNMAKAFTDIRAEKREGVIKSIACYGSLSENVWRNKVTPQVRFDEAEIEVNTENERIITGQQLEFNFGV